MFLGIEIGGTKLQLGVGTGEQPVFAGFRRLDIDASKGAQGILAQIEAAGRKLVSEFPVEAIAFGFGGPIDAARGVITKSHQAAGWDGFPLRDWCSRTLGCPTYLGNDCDMAALAEARYGAGRGRRSVFYVTVGTGVGGGLVIDGRLYGGHRPAIAEIGHLRPGLDATSSAQSVESLASGRGIEAAARALVEKSDSPAAIAELLDRCAGDPRCLTAKSIGELAASGNEIARAVMENACRALGWAIAQVITILAVEAVVIGGGVSLASPSIFLDPLRDFVRLYMFPPLADSYQIVPAALGEEVVVHGAVAMAAAASREAGSA